MRKTLASRDHRRASVRWGMRRQRDRSQCAGPVIEHDYVGRGQRHRQRPGQRQDRSVGPAGLLGLLGLAGLKRRNNTNDAGFAAGPAAPGNPKYPRR